MPLETFQILGVSLGLGLLVGLEREWRDSKVAGLRTFAMVPLLGTVCAMLAGRYGGWILAAGLVCMMALTAEGHILKYREGKSGTGLTTELAALVMYAVGAALTLGALAPFVAAGAVVAVLLQWKRPLHRLVESIGRNELDAIFRLVLIGLVILPVLPDTAYGPYEVLNPFRIWLMVVLIVGITLAGYISYRLFGSGAGSLLGGLFGGLISSTATTVGYARRSKQAPGIAGVATVVVFIATTIQFVRVAFEIGVVAPAMLPKVAWPLGMMTAIVAAVGAAFYLLRGSRRQDAQLDEEDPSDLKSAVVFGLLYAVVLFGVAAARQHFGNRGLYIVAGLSGLTDMDAITLSAAQMVNEGRVAVDTGWRMIVVGGLANLVFKTVAVAALGHRRMLGRVALASAICILGGVLLLAYWPEVF